MQKSFKDKVYLTCLIILDEKIASLEGVIAGLAEGAENDSKSSAGDKHETSRAMMQIEQEKAGLQLREARDQKGVLLQTGVNPALQWIAKGSLVKTDKCFLFVCIALGRIRVEGLEVICLSHLSPLGKKLMGLKQNETAEVAGTKYRIEKVS